MTHFEVFKGAKWIGAGDESVCPVIRGKFKYKAGETAKITVLGLASFVLFINGERVHDEYFLPLNSDFEERNYPSDEVLQHRAYPEQFDIDKYLHDGENVIAVMLGNGWYNDIRHFEFDKNRKPYGNKKVCWRIEFSDGVNSRDYLSDTNCKWLPSFVTRSVLCKGENHDYSNFDFNCLNIGFDDQSLPNVIEEKPLDTTYCFTNCPRDKVVQKVIPTVVSKGNNYVVYDVGKNTTGTPVITGKGTVKVLFAEQLSGDNLDDRYIHGQFFNADFSDKKISASLIFTWSGFRYFRVEGDASVECVNVIHSNVKITSDFQCSDNTLNWLYKAYINSQLTNMHGGIPSDCPHIERRGYTGDGQLACRAAMLMLDVYDFYDKWIEDIADSQDTVSGHVQYTAPYIKSGGGPGGWGCAIVQVPYQFWKFYGDDSKIRKHYSKMLKYFDFLDVHSEFGLVTSDIEGVWCLGDWCAPGAVALPAPFVNNYFYIKSLIQVIEIADFLGHTEDIEMLNIKLNERKRAFMAAYFNTWDGRFFADVQGADAFALDVGLGDDRTPDNFFEYYEKTGAFDTGIFGTDIVTRQLFKMGKHDLAFRLLTAETPVGIGEWYKRGLTTTPEYWTEGRSLNHPMFGVVSAYLFEEILGIKQNADSVAFEKITISPAVIEGLSFAKGHISTVQGVVEVSYVKTETKTDFSIKIPNTVQATFVYGGKTVELSSGENQISV